MKGEVNAADAVSKLHFNAVELINSDLYRHGPTGLAIIDGKEQVPFYQMTKEGEKFIPLPPELINRARDQEEKLLALDPEMTLSNKIENLRGTRRVWNLSDDQVNDKEEQRKLTMALEIMHGTRSQMWTYRGPVIKRLTNKEKDHSRERVHRTPYRETDCRSGNERSKATSFRKESEVGINK